MRVSVSNLDLFRKWRGDEEFPLHILLQQLRRESGPTLLMRAGSALHELLEKADECETETATVGDFRFTFNLDAGLCIAPFRELSATRRFVIDGTEVTLSARADCFFGKKVEDHKLTAYFDAERYAESIQWRAYLLIYGADQFTYNVFVGDVEERKELPHDVTIRDFHRLTFYRYPEMEQDVRDELARYVEFARAHLLAA
jgi:hypothetical protein